MKHSLKGFNVATVAIMLCAVVLVGSAGWYFWQSSSQDDNVLLQEQFEKSRDELLQKEFEDKNFVNVPKWDVKVGIGPNIPKVTVSEPVDLENNKSEIKITVKPPFLVYKDCGSEITVTRLQDITGLAEAPIHNVGDYYYYNSSVSDCSTAQESLNMDVLNHIELVEYFDSLGVKALY